MALLTATSGTLLAAAILGAAIGLVLAGAAVTAGPGTEPALTRRGVVRLAVALAIAMVGATALGVWFVARTQGGVLDPVSHAWTVYGFGFPALAAAAAIAAAWGAANGPVRG
jgi:cytochrome bd-type quinol oxidase subunit 2